MTTLFDVQSHCQQLSFTREKVSDIVKQINDEVEAIYAKHARALKRAVNDCAQAQHDCESIVRDSAELFEKPRTQVFHGIKVGFRKGVGGLDWDDDDAVVARIEKMFGKQAEGFLIITKTPAKDILADLPASDLKTLGVTVEKTGDVVVVKAVDTAVDKTVKALLKNAAKELEEA